ncbi:MAG: TetR family transcriptional regulator [Sciscionella sp.]
MPTTTPNRRDRKKETTRRALRRAAVALVDERGFDGVTVQDISDVADVAPRTFFNYFASKEEALASPDPEDLARLGDRVAARPSSEPPTVVLRTVLMAEAADMAERRDEWLHQLAVLRRDPRLMAALAGSWWEIERTLSAALCERSAKPSTALIPAVLVAGAVGAFRVALSRWQADHAAPLAEVLACAFDAWSPSDAGLPGVPATQGEKL